MADTDSQKVSLTHFCVHLSSRVRAPEMIGAFEHSERVAKRMMDSTENYQARYEAFTTQPA